MSKSNDIINTDIVKTLLTEWELHEVIGAFEENAIDYKAFLTLTDDDIKELIPKIGYRKKFLNKHSSYVLEKALEEPLIVIEPKENKILINSNEKANKVHNIVGTSTPSTDITLELDKYPIELEPGVIDDNDDSSSCVKASIPLQFPAASPVHNNNCINKLLVASTEGKQILASYSATSKTFLRAKLCQLVIREELKCNPATTISTERFLELSASIIEVFPQEEASLYYVPYEKNPHGHPRAARGKLFSTYHYLRKQLKQFGLLPSPNAKQNQQVPSASGHADDDLLQDYVQWLHYNVSPFTYVIEKWELTTLYRIRTFSNLPINDYITYFPGLQQPLGYTLLIKDFSILYPGKENLLFAKWSTVHAKILKICETRKDSFLKQLMEEYNNIKTDDNSDDVFVLTILPLLLPCVSWRIKRKKGKDITSFKPSKTEQLNGFLLHVKDQADLQPALEARRERYERYSLTEQPIPVIVGSSITNIESSYVVVNKTLYTIETPLKAVDTCFKMCHALNAKYAIEVESVWTFIQKYFFGIHTEHDKHYVSVNTLIADLARQ